MTRISYSTFISPGLKELTISFLAPIAPEAKFVSTAYWLTMDSYDGGLAFNSISIEMGQNNLATVRPGLWAWRDDNWTNAYGDLYFECAIQEGIIFHATTVD